MVIGILGPHGVVLPPPLSSFGPRGLIPESVWLWCYGTLTGITGHVALFALILIVWSSGEPIRRKSHEVFFVVHQLMMVVFFGALLVHGLLNLVEDAQFWMWFIGPGVLYLFERMIRIVRSSVVKTTVEAIQHEGAVLELRLRREDGKGFSYRSGQYCFLKIPELSLLEWHPFTITSAPNQADNFISFHIKDSGDWTRALQTRLNPEKLIGPVNHPNPPRVLVDGGLGSASEDCFKFKNS